MAQAITIKTPFDLYDAKVFAMANGKWQMANGKSTSNQATAKKAKYSVSEKTKTREFDPSLQASNYNQGQDG